MIDRDTLAARLYEAGKAFNDKHGLGDYALPWGALADNDYARDEFKAIAAEAIRALLEQP